MSVIPRAGEIGLGEPIEASIETRIFHDSRATMLTCACGGRASLQASCEEARAVVASCKPNGIPIIERDGTAGIH
jgi:hypothetical protein